MEFGTPQFWVAALEIVAINVLLSGDNAVVIALACRDLPPRQRRLGMIGAASGAIALRIALTLVMVGLLERPFLRLAGGLVLLWIAVKVVQRGEDGNERSTPATDSLLAAVATIVLADLVMSVDNVLGVAAAAKGSVSLLAFGLVVSIPLVVAGSQLVVRLIERFPILIVAGGGLLGFVAGEMLVQDAAVRPWIDARAKALVWIAPVAGVALVVGAAQWMQRRQSARQGN